MVSDFRVHTKDIQQATMRLRSASWYIILSIISSFCNGAVVRHCTGFEGKLGSFSPQLWVESYRTELPSTVLISYLSDVDSALVNDIELDVTIDVPAHWYPLAKNGTDFDESVVLKSNVEFEVVNTELQYGESVMYNATYAGVYCVLVHQDADSVQGVGVTSNHIYGDYPLTGLYWLKTSLLLLMTFLLHHFVLPWLFPNINETHAEESMWHYLTYSLVGKICNGIGKVLIDVESSSLKCTIESHLKSPWFNPWSLANHLISLAVITFFYRLSVGILSFQKNASEADPIGRVCDIGMIAMLEFLLMPMALPEVSDAPLTLFLYSIVCDGEASVYMLMFSILSHINYIEGEEKVSEWFVKGSLQYFICPLHLPITMPMLGYIFRTLLHPTSDPPPYDIYRLKDPCTSYNYIIMWNVLCNTIYFLPGMLMEKLSTKW